MFERFTETARTAVVEAQVQARALGAQEVRAEHLLLALAQDGAPAAVLREAGVTRERLTREVAALGDADADALKAIGVDLASVRRSAEDTFGPGALDRPKPVRRGLFRRRTVRVGGGHLRFTSSAKRALEQSLRQALAVRSGSIGAEHLLLGLLADDGDAAARTLTRVGADPQAVRDAVHRSLRRSA